MDQMQPFNRVHYQFGLELRHSRVYGSALKKYESLRLRVILFSMIDLKLYYEYEDSAAEPSTHPIGGAAAQLIRRHFCNAIRKISPNRYEMRPAIDRKGFWLRGIEIARVAVNEEKGDNFAPLLRNPILIAINARSSAKTWSTLNRINAHLRISASVVLSIL